MLFLLWLIARLLTRRWLSRRPATVRVGAGQELYPGHGGHPLVGQHQRHLPAVGSDLLQPLQRGLRVAVADHR